MPWVEDLGTLCQNVGAATPGYDLFTSLSATLPTLASGVVSVIEYDGGPPERTQNSVLTPGYINVKAQFMVRALTPDLARLKARACYAAVTGLRNAFINSGWYREITALGEPVEMPTGDRGQRVYKFSVRGVKRPEVIG